MSYTATEKTKWQHLELDDADGDAITNESYRVNKLREYRATGGMHGVFFAGMDWDEEPAIDWTGFPSE